MAAQSEHLKRGITVLDGRLGDEGLIGMITREHPSFALEARTVLTFGIDKPAGRHPQ